MQQYLYNIKIKDNNNGDKLKQFLLPGDTFGWIP